MEVSKEEAEMIWQGNCPCGGEHCLLYGPCGGLSINVKCEKCGQKYNIPPRPFVPERLN